MSYSSNIVFGFATSSNFFMSKYTKIGLIAKRNMKLLLLTEWEGFGGDAKFQSSTSGTVHIIVYLNTRQSNWHIKTNASW